MTLATNRTTLRRNRRPTAVSPYAVQLFRELVQIEKSGAHETWEDEGGKRRHYFNLSTALELELNLQPTIPSVMDVSATDECQPGDIDWEVVRWRRLLEQAARAKNKNKDSSNVVKLHV